MDTELARTFLTIVATGHFSAAADRLHVTQSTISARIRTLETELGCTLFVRNKAGTRLTAAGRQFQKHASMLVRTIEQARQDVGVPRGFRSAITIGGRFGLWEQFLVHLVPVMQQRAPDVSIRAEIGLDKELMQGLTEGRLDIGVMYTPESRPGLKVERLFEERLVLVSTGPTAGTEPGPGYVYVDWGPEFYAKHSASFPEFIGPGFTVHIGWIGLQHILANGGSGYFPLRLVRDLIDASRLALVEAAPSFSLSAYMAFPVESDIDCFDRFIDGMRELAQREAMPPGGAEALKA